MQEPRPSCDRTPTATGATPEPSECDDSGGAGPTRPAEPPDGHADSPTGHADPPGDPVTAPVRLPDDDFIAETDRQVLVVGDSAAGLALTLLLGRAGYDPVLVAGPETPQPSRLSTLWPPARRVLDAAGVDVGGLGCAVDSVAVRSAPLEDATVLSREADAPALPVLVRTSTLRQRLEAHLPDARGGRDRTVDSVSCREGGLVVGFDDGVREWFDVAVDASVRDAPLRADAGRTAPRTGGEAGEFTTLTQYEVPLEAHSPRNATPTSAPVRIREGWQPGALVQSLPHPGSPGHLLRVTAVGRDAPAVTEGVRRALPDAARVPDLSDVEPASVAQVSSLPADPTRGWWGDGRVAFCGGAACPLPPASGVRVSAGIEDALALVAQLARGPRSTADAVDAYAARRARRVGRLARSAMAARTDHGYPVPDRTQPGLATLGLLRTVALGPVLGSPVAGLQREGIE